MLSLALQALLTVAPAQSQAPSPSPRTAIIEVVPSQDDRLEHLRGLGYVEVPQDSTTYLEVEPPQGARQQFRARVLGSGVGRAAVQGEPSRGHLGVTLLDDDDGGIGISAVSEGSAAAHAGLRAGDRILSIDSHPTDQYTQVLEILGQRPAGTEVRLRIRRTLKLDLAADARAEEDRLALGVTLAEGTDRDLRAGLHVKSSERGYPAVRAGVQAGDTIVAIDGHELGARADLVKYMKSIGEPRSIEVAVERDVRATLGSAPGTVLGLQLDAPRTTLTLPQIRRFREVAPTPSAPRAEPRNAEPEAALRDELRALSEELKALRDELADLRSELQTLRRQRQR